MSIESPSTCPHCGSSKLWQDPDVLDTWFSSWLWPFSTLGWPEKTKDLSTFYPTSVLVTGQDIIFFWVARMVMAGKFFMKQIPFKDVYIHGIIRVEGGKKMSKSLGNIIDPLQMIDQMGADALRFCLAHMTSEGQDLYISDAKFLLGRNFANKLWNAARLILEGTKETSQTIPFNARFMTLADRWILSRLQELTGSVTKALADYRFNEAARLLYQFIWHEFCDWYLEIAKLQRDSTEAAVIHNTDHILLTVLETSLRLLHPFMPFITEELVSRLDPESEGRTLLKASWPEPESAWADPAADQAFARLEAVVTEVRNIRATFRVPAKEKMTLLVQGRQGTELLTQHIAVIQRLGAVQELTIQNKIDRPSGSVVSHLGAQEGFDSWDLIVPLAGLVDLGLERQRIEKELKALENRAQAKKTRLNDPTFRSKAPSDVIAEEEESLKEVEAQLSKWTESLQQIKGV